VHFSLGILLIALLVLHVGAALRHHFVKRDDVLARMLPARNP
jgi:cytochrome b561